MDNGGGYNGKYLIFIYYSLLKSLAQEICSEAQYKQSGEAGHVGGRGRERCLQYRWIDDNGINRCVVLPSPTVDWARGDGVKEFSIEQMSGHEVTHRSGRTKDGRIELVRFAPEGAHAANYGFEVTSVLLATAAMTERGVSPADRKFLRALYS